jgi:regulator of sigma E protease
VLDGGHVVLFTIEKLKGSPLSPRMLEVATQIGLCLLLALMVFAVHNDIVSIFL